ncbi:MAG: ImmA/IrrE family metallo-endopeptidase [Bryobacteraceae bacterium]|jgi:plasmid maintenance system antidote protein VapI/Zn-dependent peptidase ImmA (M78 family)
MADILAERSLSLTDFAQRIGQTPEQARDLLQGRATITIRIARLLEQVLGASVEFWISRDFQYREDTARLQVADQEWLTELPIGDMIRFGWLGRVPHPSEEVAACLRFFDVPSVSAWRQAYADLHDMVVFRKSPSFDSRPAAVAAWLRRGEIESEAIECGPWNPTRFQEFLSVARSLTREKDPNRFIPELQRACAAAGVAVAVVRAPNGCRASGATRFLSPNKALLLLSFRFLSDDQFWFTFFHEAGHLVLHGDRGLFLEGVDTPSTADEQEASDFAERTLVPPQFQQALLSLPADGRQVIRFARRLGIAPGIVVGQLQHHGRIQHRELNSLKRRFKWEE